MLKDYLVKKLQDCSIELEIAIELAEEENKDLKDPRVSEILSYIKCLKDRTDDIEYLCDTINV